MDAYYRGRPPKYPWLPEQAQQEFTRLLAMTRANVLGLVVDTVAERMLVDGFRIGKGATADQATWAIWQANNLDSASDQGILEALIGGQAYTLVAPNDADPTTPKIWVEHPSQATVEYVPGSARQERAAGLKVWCDDWTGMDMATLYLPDAIYKFQAPRKTVEGSTSVLAPAWQRREVRGEAWPARNPLGVVPLIELPNNPRLLTGGISEIDDLIPTQDRINKTLADRLMTQDFGAFPQKWATGFPDTDGEGVKQRVDVGRNRMVTSDIAETKFGQWDSAALEPYLAAKRDDTRDAASRSRTPAQYLLGDMSNVNGETLKASESGLVSKTRQRMRPVGEGLEETMRLARRIAGLPGDDRAMETIWKNPEFRTEGELVDALVKMSTLGVPEEALWERWGATQVEIERWKAMRASVEAEGLAQLLKAPPQQPQAVPGGAAG
jgi:hypothetical protein